MTGVTLVKSFQSFSVILEVCNIFYCFLLIQGVWKVQLQARCQFQLQYYVVDVSLPVRRRHQMRLARARNLRELEAVL